MVLSPSFLLSALVLVATTTTSSTTVFGFVPTFQRTTTSSSRSEVVALHAINKNEQQNHHAAEVLSRRDLFVGAAGTATSSFAAAATMLVLGVPAANADSRPMYLTEPTQEFRDNEAKAMEFKRKQLVIKKQFVDVIERFLATSKTESEIVKDLNEMQDLVITTGGLPLGIKKEELFKNIRRKKSLGFWPTNCEIAYQDLIREIAFQQSPNKEKDTFSPI
mmetsp:Transcript_45101/g.66983  ORF Transcript_45101/g.66983 Transcript_45101/m.66983 type:complete len:220 (-) Transcript_45101:301-960(-)|eukprot:CAMPEP_0194041218 /NCGR_PEP_ID=MMETSP0009_2-20130614/13111_1 /TAXON_ID=210454 /ORGANISM="Grammatophora oceanica, Strain CCMP 410" /LENGTH=219 /DNA_ID=CAMNT_0038684615 /DNA_START=172 /DNA_END=831 /DNA_ORIENTATION=+